MEKIRLPDDILIYLSKFLNNEDCLNLSLSGAFDRFALLHGEKRKFSITQCYSLTPSILNEFISRWIFSAGITTFDVSSCYWLPADSLLEAIESMTELESLCIIDTKIPLNSLVRVFDCCVKITSLSFSLLEENWGRFVGNPILELGFSRLKHLKILTLALKAPYCIDSWLITLSLLGWCRSCVDLHIEMSYTRDYFNYGPSDYFEHDHDVIQYAQLDLLPRLSWINALESLVFVKRGAHKIEDVFVPELLHWIFTEHSMDSLQRLWIQEFGVADVVSDLTVPSMTSLLLGGNLLMDITHSRFSRMTHIGGIGFSRMEHLPHLLYARGYCVDDEGLREFCLAHPKLEHLCFDTYYGSICLDGQWALDSLQVLVYSCSSPEKDVVERMVEACPNIVELHIGDLFNCGSLSSDGVDFLAAIRLEHLTHLSFSGFDLFDGIFLPSIITGCPRLRSLYLYGLFETRTFLVNLRLCLPLAVNLRNFRLQWERQEDPEDVMLLLDTLRTCRDLERVVLYQEKLSDSNLPEWNCPDLPDLLVQLVLKMDRLTALCLICFHLSPSLIREVNQKLCDVILPTRMSFWHHVDLDLPKENDPKVPRVHHDEIVNPISYFDAPPTRWL